MWWLRLDDNTTFVRFRLEVFNDSLELESRFRNGGDVHLSDQISYFKIFWWYSPPLCPTLAQSAMLIQPDTIRSSKTCVQLIKQLKNVALIHHCNMDVLEDINMGEFIEKHKFSFTSCVRFQIGPFGPLHKTLYLCHILLMTPPCDVPLSNSQWSPFSGFNSQIFFSSQLAKHERMAF